MKYIFFTNIPAPYRISFYNELLRRGFPFEVYYMRITESDRHWNVKPSQIRHPAYVDRGFYATIGRFHVHFNPRLIVKLLRANGAEIIIGGSWNDINVLLLVILKRLRLLRSQLHFWSEANYLTIGASHDNIAKRLLRRFVYHSSSGAQISSGRMTELTLQKWGVTVHRYVPLPNTIEEEKFTVSEGDLERRRENALPVLLMPVRLSEKIKGFINFFEAIGVKNIRKGLFLVAGDGPDRAALERFVSSTGVEANIKVLGHCGVDELVSLYRRANVFVLPSFSDPSPLTLVEALRMRLPVLVSDRCGNHYEAVQDGRNGYLFDPLTAASVKRAFDAILNRRPEWPEMGSTSGAIYDEVFHRGRVIDAFVESLMAFSGEYLAGSLASTLGTHG